MPTNTKWKNRLAHEQCEKLSHDTHAMTDAANNVISSMKTPSVKDMIEATDGDKFKLAYEMTREELGTSGTIEQYKKGYKTKLHDINRYLKGERKPSKEVQERFKRMFRVPSDKNLSIQVQGCGCVSDDCGYRKTSPKVIPASEVNDFLKATLEDNDAGYKIWGEYYGVNIDWKSNVKVSMSLE